MWGFLREVKIRSLIEFNNAETAHNFVRYSEFNVAFTMDINVKF